MLPFSASYDQDHELAVPTFYIGDMAKNHRLADPKPLLHRMFLASFTSACRYTGTLVTSNQLIFFDCSRRCSGAQLSLIAK